MFSEHFKWQLEIELKLLFGFSLFTCSSAQASVDFARCGQHQEQLGHFWSKSKGYRGFSYYFVTLRNIFRHHWRKHSNCVRNGLFKIERFLPKWQKLRNLAKCEKPLYTFFEFFPSSSRWHQNLWQQHQVAWKDLHVKMIYWKNLKLSKMLSQGNEQKLTE